MAYVKVNYRDTTTVKQILRVVFCKDGVPKILISENASDFYDED